MWITLFGDGVSAEDKTDIADRLVKTPLQLLPGIARVMIGGERRYAMRIWLDRQALAAHRLTVADVEAALRAENVELPAGRLESSEREFTLRTDTGFTTAEDFRRLVVLEVLHQVDAESVRPDPLYLRRRFAPRLAP